MDKKTKNFFVRLTPANKRKIERRAKEMGISLTAFINIIISKLSA